MTTGATIENTVDIRPGVSVLSVLRHLKYRPWFALAEFVDNAVQSYLTCRTELEALGEANFRLLVTIDIDPADGGSIVVRDNAAGIRQGEYARAFRAAAIPTDRNGLSEFGMGMKSAACWFARNWSVRTSALGEGVEKAVQFDIDRIVKDTIEELSVKSKPMPENAHFTELKLWNLYATPHGTTVGKIKKHLASIYRVFLRSGMIELVFNREKLAFEDTPILVAPPFRMPKAEPLEWRKPIDFDFGEGQRCTGFAALRQTGLASGAGFALFRRDRLIEGSGEDTYLPTTIFGAPNSFASQRLFGELHLEGFEVSHTKDGFQWDDLEDVFLDFLREHVNSAPLDLLSQAEGYRARTKPGDWQKSAQVATESTANALEQNAPPVLERQLATHLEASSPAPRLPEARLAAHREFEVKVKGETWRVRLEASHDASVGDWLGFADTSAQVTELEDGTRFITLRVSLAHPFVERFFGADQRQLEPMLRLAAGIGLAEAVARQSGVTNAGSVRRNLNELLRDALSSD